jgi:hypothetical protein
MGNHFMRKSEPNTKRSEGTCGALFIYVSTQEMCLMAQLKTWGKRFQIDIAN